MSNLVEVNDWDNLSNVKVGSVIDVFDTERKVVENTGSDLILQGPFGSRQNLSSIYESRDDDFDGGEQEIYIKSEPEEVVVSAASGVQYRVCSGPASHSEISARFAKPVASAQECLKQDMGAHFGARNVQSKPFNHATAFGTPRVAVDPAAELRSQLASVASRANEAQYQAKSVTEAVRNVRSDVSQVSHRVTGTIGAVDELSSRVAKLELHQKVTTGLNSQAPQIEVAQKAQGGTSMSLKNILGNFTTNFGKVENQFALTAIGLAVKADPKNPFSEYVVYDAKTNSITDASGLVVTKDIPAFKLPVSPDQVKAGDIIVNDNKYQYVVETSDDYVTTVCPSAKSRGTAFPLRNAIMNQAFYTVVKTLDLAGQSGFNPMLLMAMGDGNKDKMLPLMLMSGGLGNGQGGTGAIDPMMLALLGDNMDDILPFILMQQGGAAPAGFNPLMLLLLAKDGGSNKDMLLPLILGGGLGGATGAAGANLMSNPLMMMALLGDKGGKGGGIDPMMLMMMSGGLGGAGGGLNLFGGAPATPAAPQELAQNKDGK